jgi:hypothetical protein
MRTLNPAAQAAMESGNVREAALVEMYLTQTVRFCSAPFALPFDGNEYTGLGNLGAVGEVDDSPGEYKNLQFTLSGVSLDLVSIAMQEPIRGKRVVLRHAVVSNVDFTVLDAPIVWTGTLDQMPLLFGDATGEINVTAEHRGVTFGRPKQLLYTDDDQQRLYPGDTFLQYIQYQSTHEDTWPAASYYRR